jgi:hypothetical protein
LAVLPGGGSSDAFDRRRRLSLRETWERRQQKTAEEVIEPRPASVLDDPEPNSVAAGHDPRVAAKAKAASELRAQGRTLTGIAVLVGLNVPQSAHQAIRRCREQQTGQAPRVQRLAY